MNKTELIDRIAESADLSKAAAGRALDAALDAITVSLQQADPVALVGFGTFSVRDRAARTGRNHVSVEHEFVGKPATEQAGDGDAYARGLGDGMAMLGDLRREKAGNERKNIERLLYEGVWCSFWG